MVTVSQGTTTEQISLESIQTLVKLNNIRQGYSCNPATLYTFHRRKFSGATQLFLYFLCFLRYDTFVWKSVDRAVCVLPHSLKRLLRKYNGEFGLIGMGGGFEATKLDTGIGGSHVCFNWDWSEAPLIWVDDWGWIAIDRGMA